MLLAIDLGNTKAAFGVWSGTRWTDIRQWPSQSLSSSPELFEWLSQFRLGNGGIKVVCASVNPSAEASLTRAIERTLYAEIHFLRTAQDFKLKTLYSPELGADRMANMVGALDQFKPPLIVIDVGTATTIDAIDKTGSHIGGVIFAGPQFSIDALLAKSPLMKPSELRNHEELFSLNTTDALSNGHFLSHWHALLGIEREMKLGMKGRVSVVTTGGLGRMFSELGELGEYRPTLALEGIRIVST